MTENRSWLTPSSVELDPTSIFTDLVISSAFEPRSASIEEKRLIFGKVWAGDIPRLCQCFDSAGMDRRESYGFGFLVEAFARHSKSLPRKNTGKGEEAARTILSELHTGNRGQIKLGQSQSNSDFLWVELTGRLITITGIGEVKSSYKVASQKVGGQLKRQEKSLTLLKEGLKIIKANKSVRGFFQKRNITISDTLERFLIVPFGEGEEARLDEEFRGWKIVELEFSYDELVFIAQQIWPDFRPDIRFVPGKLANLFQIAGKFGENWFKSRLDKVFYDSKEFGSHNPLPYFELGLFFLATGKTPMLEDEVKLLAELVQKSFWLAMQRCLNSFLNSTPNPAKDFSEREKRMFERFRYTLTSSREDLENFIYFTHSLNAQINDLARDQHQLRKLKSMSEVWSI